MLEYTVATITLFLVFAVGLCGCALPFLADEGGVPDRNERSESPKGSLHHY